MNGIVMSVQKELVPDPSKQNMKLRYVEVYTEQKPRGDGAARQRT
eukprot:COSAG02_NODE_2504_length_8663_cov_3.628211_7_plen_45_part_00